MPNQNHNLQTINLHCIQDSTEKLKHILNAIGIHTTHFSMDSNHLDEIGLSEIENAQESIQCIIDGDTSNE
jgi:hypothetical protein